jgi:hypothetical protein
MKPTIILFLAVALVGGCSKPKANEPAQDAPKTLQPEARKTDKKAEAKKVDPVQKYIDEVRASNFRNVVLTKDLLEDFSGNRIAADKRYQNERFAVTGAVRKVDKSILGKPYVLLDDGPLTVTAVRCELADSDGVDDLTKNKVITIWGKCSSGNNLGVTMVDCRIMTEAFVEVAKQQAKK